MKHIIGLLAMLLPILSGAQSPPIKPLNIGDTVPDISITNVYNYPASTIQLSDLKGKLVILDFWSTWCGACIEAFPKMHHLQKEFGNQLQVILINTYKGDTIERVKPFFEKRKARTGEGVTLPYSLLQSSLSQYFPHKFIPHYIWINKEGIVSAITSATEVTSANITAMLQGKAPAHQKKDLLKYDYSKPLFVNGNGGNADTFLFRSILTNYIEGVGSTSGIIRNADAKVTMLYTFNNTILGLIRRAFSDNTNIAADRIIVETKDTSKFSNLAGQGNGWYKNSYCYQVSVPPSTMTEVLSFMKEDITRAFRIRVSNEKRKTKCLVLLPASNNKKLITKGGVHGLTSGNRITRFTNVSVAEIATWFEERLHIPVINETGLQENVDICLPASFDFTNRAMVIQALIRAGFKAAEIEKEMEYAVISDLN